MPKTVDSQTNHIYLTRRVEMNNQRRKKLKAVIEKLAAYREELEYFCDNVNEDYEDLSEELEKYDKKTVTFTCMVKNKITYDTNNV